MVLTEDDIGRWFLEKILERNSFPYSNKMSMPDISIGWTQLIILIRKDHLTFKNCLIFLDPDLSKVDNRKNLNDLIAGSPFSKSVNSKDGNIFFVELGENIEKIFYSYLFNLEKNAPLFFDPSAEDLSLTYHSLRNGGPLTQEYESIRKDFDKIKVWFKENQYIFDISFSYWYETEKDKLDDFYHKFNTAFHRILNQI